ncbi:MAG: hypothetical protein ACP5ID_05080 [Conexivisphaera sp.]
MKRSYASVRNLMLAISHIFLRESWRGGLSGVSRRKREAPHSRSGGFRGKYRLPTYYIKWGNIYIVTKIVI